MPSVTENARRTLDANAATSSVPHWLWSAGLSSWLGIGIVGAAILVLAFITISSSISVPLIVAVVVGAIAAPLVESMHKRGMPKTLAATIVLLALIAIIALTLLVTVNGVLSQASHIQEQLQTGLGSLETWLQSLGVNTTALKGALSPQSTASAGKVASSGFLSSIGSALSIGLSRVFGLFLGTFISFALLFYVLSDFPTIANWIGSHMGLPTYLGEGIVRDAVDSLRGYFKGTTLSGIAVALVIGVGVWALGVPLAIPIALVTFLTCYIPFFGAIVSGAFACLVALGAAGPTKAVVVLVLVLVAQNLLQTLINAKTMGDSLDLSALVVLVVTMLGGVFGGILGTVLAAPLTALVLRAHTRLRAARENAMAGGEADVKSPRAAEGA